ncbi:MAG TPA: YhjD/YihY/BrkB family envelope integrity protein [Ktedonobacteraceae bacterium]|nr:YhjD/YihY/BrkB family envelope integrity protein [Ktedonobacteraceae bacterium]
MATRRQIESTDAVKQNASEAINTVKTEARPFARFTQKFYRDWSFHLAQALAFSLITALVPIAILLLAILGGFIGGLDHKAADTLIGQLAKTLPGPLSSQEVLRSAASKLTSASGALAWIAILTAIFVGSRLFTLMEVCFDIIFRLRPRPQAKKNIMAIIMLFVFVVLTPVLVLASLIPGQILAILQHTSISTNPSLLARIGGILSSLLVSFLLFEVIYAFVPNRRITMNNLMYRLQASWPGAATAAVALQIWLILFPLYTRSFMNGYVGQIGFVLILLAFFYFMTVVLLLGAEVNAFFIEKIPPTEHDLITRASQSS